MSSVRKCKTRSVGGSEQPERYAEYVGEDLWREPVEMKNRTTHLRPEDGV